jgi:hypothetical protein
MCFKKKPEIVPITGDKVALLFGINDYMGNSNDLNGCLNDIDDVEKKLNKEFPGFQIRKFKDSQVTTQRFISEVEAAYNSPAKIIYIHYSGHGTTIGNCEALYLYNGPLLDDVVCDLEDKTPADKKVTAKFDSCFSGGMDDRHLNPRYIRNRYYPVPGTSLTTRATKQFAKREVHKWTIFSGCGSEQTSADFYYNGRYNGAFTVFDLKSYGVNSDYQSEQNMLRTYLPNLAEGLDQAPELTGPSLTDLVFQY